MQIESITIIHSLIIWQSLLFAIVLLTPKYLKKKGNLFLALFLLTLGLHFTYNILLTNQLYLDILPQFSCTYGYLYGPFIFFYIKYHLHKDFHFKPVHFIHFIPFVTVISVTLFGFSICNKAMYLVVPVMLVYCLLGFIDLNTYKKTIRQIVSNHDRGELKWIKTLLIFMLIVLLLNLIQMRIGSIKILSLEIQLEHIVQLGILVIVNIITYQGLKNPLFFQQISKEQLNIVQKNKDQKRSDVAHDETYKKLASKLETYMQQEKPYLNSELDLSTLAKILDVHPKTLSIAINQILHCSFSEYINSYRINEAKALLENNTDEQLTIMEVMYDVGFNSRSVFNTLFKKKTGLTPSQYKKQQGT